MITTEKLKDPNVILGALVLCLIVQMSHSVVSYLKLVESDGVLFYWNLLMGIFFASALSLSILIHTVHRVVWVAYVYLVVELIINLIYYNVHKNSLELVIPQILFSLFIPFTISRYSDLMKKLDNDRLQEEAKKQKAIKKDNQDEKIEQLTNEIQVLKHQTENYQEVLDKPLVLKINDKDYNIILQNQIEKNSGQNGQDEQDSIGE